MRNSHDGLNCGWCHKLENSYYIAMHAFRKFKFKSLPLEWYRHCASTAKRRAKQSRNNTWIASSLVLRNDESLGLIPAKPAQWAKHPCGQLRRDAPGST